MKEKVLWWIVAIVFGVFLALVALNIIWFSFMGPEFMAFLIGLFVFWLLGNRLMFGYGNILNFLYRLKLGDEIDKEDIYKKIPTVKDLIKDIAILDMLSHWSYLLSSYKYTFYSIFFMVFIVMIIFKLNIIGYFVFGPVVEGVFWGASIPVFFVWAIEFYTNSYIGSMQ